VEVNFNYVGDEKECSHEAVPGLLKFLLEQGVKKETALAWYLFDLRIFRCVQPSRRIPADQHQENYT